MMKIKTILISMAVLLLAAFVFAGNVSRSLGNGTISTGYGSGSVVTAVSIISTAPACVGTFFSDTFTESGTGNINLDQHTPDIGGLWIGTDAGDGSIVLDRGNDEIKSTVSGGVSKTAYSNLTANCADYSVFANVKIGASGTSNRVEVLGRYLDTSGGNGYRARLSGDGTAQLAILTNGTGIELDADPVAGFSASAYYDVELRMTGSTISMYVNGVLECTATDTTHTANGTNAVILRNTACRVTSTSLEYL